ncbi:MAG: AAA family ATPase [Candidatus Bathyarchaeota archaeon]|nr:AAA family ATPase [Candidatus Bathyarchaeum sp.]
MKLESMQLENIRSHVKTVVPFGEGFNCLVGGVGQGKSTVLYALDFVLFGDPLGRSYDYLLREDAENGKVTAVFVHNNTKYKIQRVLQRKANGISQDVDHLKFYRDGKMVAGNKNDAVTEELKALTGLDKNIFREVIWVRQEYLKELLDITPRQRQTKLDKLFGLSDYNVAWSGLHQFEREYEIEKSVLERDADVIRINKLDGDYNKAAEESLAVASQLETMNKKVAKTQTILKEATATLESLEELRKTTEALQRKKIQIQTNIANIKRRTTELLDQKQTNKRRLDESNKLLEQLEKQKSSHQKALQEAGLGSDKTFEELKNHIFGLEEQIRTIGGEQEAIKREMKASMNTIAGIITESKCPRCLQDLTGDYKESLKKNMQKEQAENKKRLTELQKDFDKLNSRHSIVDDAVSNLQQIIPRIADTKKQVTEKQELTTKISEQLEEAQQEETMLQKQLDETRDEISKFDVTKLECARKLRDNAFTKHSEAKHELENLLRQKKDLALRVDELKERLDNAQSKIERKEKINKLLGIIDGIRVAYRSIQPKLRKEFITYLQITVQQTLDNLVGDTGPTLNIKIDETYSPTVSSEEGYEREVTNLSGGERTLLAFAYRIGLGQLIMQSRTGHGLYMLLLDEPTESLGREDGSVDRLAEAVSRLKSIEQIIAVTHNEAFAEKAEHVIRVEKEMGASQIYVEK